MTTDKELKLFKFKLSSEGENISYVESFVEKIHQKIPIQDEIYGNVLVALTEAVNNAIIHGNKNNPKKVVDMVMEKQGDTLVFTVSDEGSGFDYDSLPDPTAPENLERPSGRGVFLMKQLTDSIKFLDNGKTVQMHFKLT